MIKEKYNNYAVRDTDDPSPFNEMIRELHARNRKNTDILNILQLDWPASDDIMESLSDYISDLIQTNKESIIYPIIEEALQRYNEVVHFKKGQKKPDGVRIAVFLDAIITEFCLAMAIEISDGSSRKWRAESGERFIDWYYKCSGELSISSQEHNNENALRALLYKILTSVSLKKILLRGRYEQAIVDGHLDSSC